ncbi:cyclic dehypoxanthinyl futalosine synthase [Silvibacterium bohemicum]|uniref:Cyclic dehypoxanthinyl futalosine synthase n=1 Tax=Silvibacterium bohemicum TaxID=1577686 RepID=A0A841JXC7_9BACT|nr:dehypoxanthine futalosine cyclase [Silvibacterium bohemicum]MBB6146063.1 cyclic dehypoxanthinyl futalosine synthase [Silvibacterium bohemicum]
MAITRKQALDLFRSDDLIGLGMEADAVRRRLHPEGVVTYMLDRSVPYPSAGGLDAVFKKIDETLESGGVGVHLLGNLQPGPKIDDLESVVRAIKQRYAKIWLRGFPAPAILTLAESSHFSIQQTLTRLRDAGLDSISGEGADLQTDENTASQCSVENWLQVHRTAHQLGMATSAVMAFGAGESLEQRVDFLDQIRSLQEETGGFTAFVPRSAALAGRSMEEATAVEYLKVLAISRLSLDSIDNVQATWAAQGLKVLQMGLRFGANDVGAAIPDENPAKATTEEELRRIIRDAGFKPAQRDSMYRTMLLS